MTKTYVLIDSLNMFFRSAYATKSTSIDDQIGMALHIMFSCINKAWKDFDADHLVYCMEGNSWRKDHDELYKLHRKVAHMAKTEREQEDSKILMEAFLDFSDFVQNQTNVTCFQCPIAEADDVIAYWIDKHPDDNHVILSSDSDFQQLLAPNVKIYNGPQKYLLTTEGFFDEKNKLIIDKKTKKPKVVSDAGYYLFLKCIRGDKTDGIFSAYPGVREKGTKNKIGIIEAYGDRNEKGYAWNNFMLQKWTDSNGGENQVKDRYAHNKLLIDLHAQPEYVKKSLQESFKNALETPRKKNVGINFMKFCSKWDLNKLLTQSERFGVIFNSYYDTNG